MNKTKYIPVEEITEALEKLEDLFEKNKELLEMKEEMKEGIWEGWVWRSLRKNRNILRSFWENFTPHLCFHPCINTMWGFVHLLIVIRSFSSTRHACSCLHLVYNVYCVCVLYLPVVLNLFLQDSSFLRYRMSYWMFGLRFPENETMRICFYVHTFH